MAATSREDEAVSRWKTIIESAVDGIIVIDAQGRIEAFNPAAERLFGYRESDVVGQNVRLLMPSPHQDQHDDYLRRFLSTREPRIIGKGREVTGRRRDGTTFPIHLSVGEMVLAGESKFTGIIHDLSERVAMEEQLREQTALARLGEMAAVVAHEVKNPLAAIRAAVQTLGAQLPHRAGAPDVVTQIVGRIDSLSDLIHELLLFARPPRPRNRRVDLESVLTSTIAFVKNDPALAQVEIVIGGDAPTLVADPELLKIVFLNVMVNSGQAMAGNGRIVVDIRAAGETCAISLLDTGPGIPADAREKLFTPFFTTKHRGTGLGLATAKRLVEAHGGTIAIVCPHGGGTQVIVQLPITASGPEVRTSSTIVNTR